MVYYFALSLIFAVCCLNVSLITTTHHSRFRWKDSLFSVIIFQWYFCVFNLVSLPLLGAHSVTNNPSSSNRWRWKYRYTVWPWYHSGKINFLRLHQPLVLFCTLNMHLDFTASSLSLKSSEHYIWFLDGLPSLQLVGCKSVSFQPKNYIPFLQGLPTIFFSGEPKAVLNKQND